MQEELENRANIMITKMTKIIRANARAKGKAATKVRVKVNKIEARVKIQEKVTLVEIVKVNS